MAYFALALVVLHLAFGCLVWVLACATAACWPNMRLKLGRLVVGWFCLVAAAAIAFNALWFPRTLLGAWYHDYMVVRVGPVFVGQIIYFFVIGLSGATCGYALFKFMQRSVFGNRRHTVVAGASALLAAISLAVVFIPNGAVRADRASSQSRPNIIILGIDSLRLDHIARNGGKGQTPHLDQFLASADVVPDATTPAARTFSSWVAILTGRSPPTTGVRFNLAERSTVKATPTVADVLRKAGYRTIYSTDEVRFANFDKTYGFDQVVTPAIGASDFLIGTYNELPFTSVIVNSWIGQWLFPFSYGNRGVATMFQPQSFLSRLDREVEFDGPTLFISHLTAAHWPYYTSSTPFGIPMGIEDGTRPLYEVGLQTADSMFGQLTTMLQRKGAFENALVIVLSDHGEALGLPNDSFFKDKSLVEGLGAPLKMMDLGHGQSVLSPTQFHILLSFKTFGSALGFSSGGRQLAVPATAEDIAPTILDLLGIEGNPLRVTGRSLTGQLRGATSNAPEAGAARVRFTETDLAVLPAQNGGVDEAATAKANSKFFEIDPKSGRLHIKTAYGPLALAYKERAAFTQRHLLAAMPAGPRAHQYLYFDLATGSGKLLLARPGPEVPEGQLLWDSMATYFGAELHKPVRTTPEDWPAIGEEWNNYIAVQTGLIHAPPAPPRGSSQKPAS